MVLKVEGQEALPMSFWAKATRKIRGWAVSGRVDAASVDPSHYALQLQANSPSTALQVQGSLNAEVNELSVSSLKVSQKVDGLGGTWTFIPRYNVPANKADITVAYGFQDTVIAIDADMKKQKVTVSQQIGTDNQISPSVTTDGDVELEFRRNIMNGALTTSFKPNSHVSFRWEDGPWVADFKAPMEGLSFPEGVKMNVRRAFEIPE